MTILGVLDAILLGAVIQAGFRQRLGNRAGAGPLGLGVGKPENNGLGKMEP